MLRVRDLHAGYGGRAVLRGLDLDLARGERLGVVGLNGSGKTTLLRVLAGQIASVRGSIEWCDSEISQLPSWARFKKGIVFMSESAALFGSLTVHANIAFVARQACRSTADISREVSSWLPDLAGRVGLRVDSLSGGEYRRVALAFALACSPALLILDEPTSGLDSDASGLLVQQLVSEVSRRSMSLIFSEHNLAAVEKLASRAVVMCDGHLQSAGQGSDIEARALAGQVVGQVTMSRLP